MGGVSSGVIDFEDSMGASPSMFADRVGGERERMEREMRERMDRGERERMERERGGGGQPAGQNGGEYTDNRHDYADSSARAIPPGLLPPNPNNPLSPPNLPQNPRSDPQNPLSEDFWNASHSQYGGSDGGRIAPPPQLSFTDLKNAGIVGSAGEIYRPVPSS